MKYIKRLRERFGRPDFPVFKVSDVKIAFRKEGISSGYIHLMLHNLLKGNEVTRITRSEYTFHSDAAVVGFAFEPFYYGLENALSIMRISEQGTNFIVLTVRNVRAGVRSFKGRNYRIQRIQKQHMFGYRLFKYGEFWIPVSDLEKTIIDMIYFKDHIRKELWPVLLKRLDKRKIEKYLENYRLGFKKKVKSLIKEASSTQAHRKETIPVGLN
jgi:hypothetical protein